MAKHRGLNDLLNNPYTIRLFEEILYEDNVQEPIQEGFSHEIFKYVKPGKERICVVLKAQEFSPVEIAFLLGIERREVDKTMFEIKTRLINLGLGKRIIK